MDFYAGGNIHNFCGVEEKKKVLSTPIEEVNLEPHYLSNTPADSPEP
jgi:hypothetical protein